jgi:hypothetical protein
MSLWNLQMQQAATQRVRDRELDIYYEEQRVKATPSEIIIRRARFNWRSYRWVFFTQAGRLPQDRAEEEALVEKGGG